MTEPDEYWCQLRDAAFAYAEHGWPIAPGIRPVPRRRDGWPGPDPTVLPYHGPMNANAVVAYWQRQPYALLVGTGLHYLDVFRLRQPTATKVLHDISQRGPVAVLPDEQWLFFVEAGDQPANELLGRKVRYHGPGEWVPLPPTPIGRHEVTWLIEPASVGWRLFPRDCFYTALGAIRQRGRGQSVSPLQPPEPSSSGPRLTLIIGNPSF